MLKSIDNTILYMIVLANENKTNLGFLIHKNKDSFHILVYFFSTVPSKVLCTRKI